MFFWILVISTSTMIFQPLAFSSKGDCEEMRREIMRLSEIKKGSFKRARPLLKCFKIDYILKKDQV